MPEFKVEYVSAASSQELLNETAESTASDELSFS
jgi:hypothetical protein